MAVVVDVAVVVVVVLVVVFLRVVVGALHTQEVQSYLS